MMRTSFPCQYRQQREHTSIARRAKRQRRQRVRAPAERTDNMSETRHRIERGIEYGSAYSVIHEVKASTSGMCSNIVVDGRCLVIDERRANPLDECLVLG